jgi:hypothetical protein
MLTWLTRGEWATSNGDRWLLDAMPITLEDRVFRSAQLSERDGARGLFER